MTLLEMAVLIGVSVVSAIFGFWLRTVDWPVKKVDCGSHWFKLLVQYADGSREWVTLDAPDGKAFIDREK